MLIERECCLEQAAEGLGNSTPRGDDRWQEIARSEESAAGHWTTHS